jgi:hypothetical protein
MSRASSARSKKGVIAETTNWGEVKLPPKAERVYGKPTKSDCTAMYLDREGRVQSVHYRMPEAKKPKGGKDAGGADNAPDDVGDVSKPRPDVTRKGVEMIGDYRTDALREALGRAPIEDDALMALLILAFAGQNVSVTTGSGGVYYGHRRLAKNAAVLFDADGKLAFDMDTLRVAARTMLVDVFSCRENATNSGIVARIAGEMIGADAFLPNMGTEDFLSCLSRPALEGSCNDTPVLPRQRYDLRLADGGRVTLVLRKGRGFFSYKWATLTAAIVDVPAGRAEVRDVRRLVYGAMRHNWSERLMAVFDAPLGAGAEAIHGIEIAQDGTNPGDGTYTAVYLDAALRPLRTVGVVGFAVSALPVDGGEYRIGLPWGER